MNITATLINLYHVCHRELWLHANEIRMEHTSDLVADGKLIGDTSYTDRPGKYTQIELPGIKIDFYDPREGVVHEVKRSASILEAHIAQVKYYLYVLEQHDLPARYGILEYPAQRHRSKVELTPDDRIQIAHWVADIQRIIDSDTCPPVINKPFCKKCAFYDFCYCDEEIE